MISRSGCHTYRTCVHAVAGPTRDHRSGSVLMWSRIDPPGRPQLVLATSCEEIGLVIHDRSWLCARQSIGADSAIASQPDRCLTCGAQLIWFSPPQEWRYLLTDVIGMAARNTTSRRARTGSIGMRRFPGIVCETLIPTRAFWFRVGCQCASGPTKIQNKWQNS